MHRIDVENPEDAPPAADVSREVSVPASWADWERAPARPPLLQWRTGGIALAVVLVVAAAWWAVTWLTAPAAPSAAPLVGTAVSGAASTGGLDGETGPAEVSVADAAQGPGAASVHSGTPDADGGPSGAVRVHVVGEVARPGVVDLPAGARVADAVRAAGGATDGARTERINLAAPVADGQQVLVPDAQTDDAALAGGGPAATPAGLGAARATPGATGPADPAGAATGDGRVDLNTADAATLETLPGVGPATAEKIIAHREVVGPFTGLQDLDAVPGIGPASLARLQDSVTW